MGPTVCHDNAERFLRILDRAGRDDRVEAVVHVAGMAGVLAVLVAVADPISEFQVTVQCGPRSTIFTLALIWCNRP